MTSLIFMLYFGCVLSICQSCILRHLRVTLDIEIVYNDSLSLWLLDKGSDFCTGVPNRGGGLGGSQPPLNFGWGG